MNATGYEIADMLECSFKKVRGQLTKFNLWNRREVDPEKDPLSAWAENIVRDIFLHYKDEVIAKAAEIVADSFKRTKAWKEAAGGAMKGETENG